MRVLKIALILLICLTAIDSNASQSQHIQLKHGMVVSEQNVASEVGLDILRAGGNAIDAAIAVGYALAVTNACCGNIGGGGFMTIHLANGNNIFINFREKAPYDASKFMFIKTDESGQSTEGYLSVGVPGTVLGFESALQIYGTLTREQVMAPAIKLAEDGYRVTSWDARLFEKYAKDFAEQANVAAIFLKNGKPYKEGELLVQHDLANTLKLIAKEGPKAFYKGSIASSIVKASQTHQGLLTMNDFASYAIQVAKPIKCSYRSYTLLSAPPPSSGGITLCEMLNIIENANLLETPYQSSKSAQLIIESMRYGFADRNSKLGDPDFVSNPIEQLLSKKYAKTLYDRITSTTRNPSSIGLQPQKELTDTTHYSVIDAKGNAVSVTYTLNGFFGARVIAGNTGFFLNNEMDDFATRPGQANKFGLMQNDANSIDAGKRPLSSMTPTIITKDKQLYMVIGSPGGPRIISSVLLAILNVIDFNMPLQQAVDTPRFHYQDQPDTVFLEPLALSFLTKKQLMLIDYHLLPQHTWGAVEAILIEPETGKVQGANDRRRPDGGVAGE